MKPQTIFIAGATGYTGRALVRLAAEAGHETIAHVRPNSARLAHWKEQFESLGAKVDTSTWQAEAMGDGLVRWSPSVVYGLLGTTRARSKRESQQQGATVDYDSVDYGLTALLMGACRTLAPVPRFVYLSSTGMPTKQPREGSYMHARWKVEQDLFGHDLPYTIARPSIITGPGREDPRFGERVGAVVADMALGIAGALGARKLAGRYRSTTNETLASALLRIGLDPACANMVVESEDLR